MSSKVVRIVSLLIVGTWTGLLLARGRFWDPPVDRLCSPDTDGAQGDVAVIIPARNEVSMLPQTLPTVIAQRYAGVRRIVVADDGSTDGTAAVARRIAADVPPGASVEVVAVSSRPPGWAGKVWAMAAGVEAVRASGFTPRYWLFTDADIAHDADVLAALVATARADRRDVVSLMVKLHCATFWERALIPAFVFFFAKLYPFSYAADERRSTAAAAGGCILISDEMLVRIGGLASIANALIDDCSLAAVVKGAGGRLRLELTTRARSVRPYESLAPIWQMVARSAYTQLRESPLVLAGTLAGMLALYALPPVAAFWGIIAGDGLLAFSGAISWLLMSVAYRPIHRLYGQPRVTAPTIPLAAALYTVMTLDSARRHWNGRGGVWKGRIAGA